MIDHSNRPLARNPKEFISKLITVMCCGCLYKCIVSNGKLVMHCILTHAVVKVYEICQLHR